MPYRDANPHCSALLQPLLIVNTLLSTRLLWARVNQGLTELCHGNWAQLIAGSKSCPFIPECPWNSIQTGKSSAEDRTSFLCSQNTQTANPIGTFAFSSQMKSSRGIFQACKCNLTTQKPKLPFWPVNGDQITRRWMFYHCKLVQGLWAVGQHSGKALVTFLALRMAICILRQSNRDSRTQMTLCHRYGKSSYQTVNNCSWNVPIYFNLRDYFSFAAVKNFYFTHRMIRILRNIKNLPVLFWWPGAIRGVGLQRTFKLKK